MVDFYFEMISYILSPSSFIITEHTFNGQQGSRSLGYKFYNAEIKTT